MLRNMHLLVKFYTKKAIIVLSTKQKRYIFVLSTGKNVLKKPQRLFCFQNALYLQHNRNKIKK